LTIANGQASDIVFASLASGVPFTGGGGILVEGGSVQVQDCAFIGNVAEGGFLTPTVPLGSVGGAILSVGGSSSLNVKDSSFALNQAAGSFLVGPGQSVGSLAAGGAVAEVLGASAVVNGGSFTGNSAVGLLLGLGGAVAADSGSSLSVNGACFTSNLAADVLGPDPSNPFQGTGAGGAVVAGAGVQATLSNSTFIGNQALGGNGPGASGGNAGGGALFLTGDSLTNLPAASNVCIIQSVFAHNLAQGGNGLTGVDGGEALGGAIADSSSHLSVFGSLFASNVARGGQGGDMNDGGESRGGAIDSTTGITIFAPSVGVFASLFSNNVCQGGDGGSGGNGGDAKGGSLRIFTGTANISNTLMYGNQAIGGNGGAGGNGADGLGVGIFNGPGDPSTSQPPPVLTLTGDVITQNTAAGGAAGAGGTAGEGIGGGIYNLGSVSLKKTFVFGNFADIDPDF
jgi:hypothetical protein